MAKLGTQRRLAIAFGGLRQFDAQQAWHDIISQGEREQKGHPRLNPN
jgi:hypothetical protein